jgi:hypothetical protein
MKPEHREFFIKLLRLCREFDVKIEAAEGNGVELIFKNGTYSFFQFNQYHMRITEHVPHTIIEYEEPKP